MFFTGININRAWKDDQTWFGEYVGTYIGATLGGATDAQAHAAARAQAETGRYEPGTPEFINAFNRITNDPDLNTGSKFQDNSKIYHADANYNFSHLLDFAEIQVGGSFRTYELNSSGTIFTDADGPINYSEVGVYTQIQKSLELSDNVDLKLTGSIRYDKSELFDGFFSPRLSAGFTINENHNIRASFQTGFRNPTTQDLYIGLNLGVINLVGGAEDNPDRFVRNYPLSAFGAGLLGQPTIDFSGQGAYTNSMFASLGDALATHDPSSNGREFVANSNFAKPEQVSSVEVGYRGKLGKIVIDASAYYNAYQDFLSNETVIATYYGDNSNFDLTGYDPQNPASVAGLNQDTQLILAALQNDDFQVYRTYTNSEAEVNSYGAAIGVTTKVFGDYDFGVNYTYAKLDFDEEKNPDFQTNFNTPEHKVKATFGNTNLFENFGFGLAWRWSDTYVWEAGFGDGNIPAFHVIDAQINYRIPSLKTTLKAGATNLLQDEYITAIGTGNVGSMYYLSLTINNL